MSLQCQLNKKKKKSITALLGMRGKFTMIFAKKSMFSRMATISMIYLQ